MLGPLGRASSDRQRSAASHQAAISDSLSTRHPRDLPERVSNARFVVDITPSSCTPFSLPPQYYLVHLLTCITACTQRVQMQQTLWRVGRSTLAAHGFCPPYSLAMLGGPGKVTVARVTLVLPINGPLNRHAPRTRAQLLSSQACVLFK